MQRDLLAKLGTDDIKAVVDQLFTVAETKYASHPLILSVIASYKEMAVSIDTLSKIQIQLQKQ